MMESESGDAENLDLAKVNVNVNVNGVNMETRKTGGISINLD